jgi:hypothetical protein
MITETPSPRRTFDIDRAPENTKRYCMLVGSILTIFPRLEIHLGILVELLAGIKEREIGLALFSTERIDALRNKVTNLLTRTTNT